MVAPFVHFVRSLEECSDTGLNKQFFCDATHISIGGFVLEQLQQYAEKNLSTVPLGSKVDSEFEPVEVYKLPFGPEWQTQLMGFWNSVCPDFLREAQTSLAKLTIDNTLEKQSDADIEAIQSFLALRNLIRDVSGELLTSEKLGDLEDPALLIYDGEIDHGIKNSS